MYPHLSVFSDSSLLNGASKPKNIVATAKKLGMNAIALTDKNTLSSSYEFSKLAKAENIKPIIGCQMPMEFASSSGQICTAYMTFLAMNEQGYKNICRIMANAQKPREGNNSPVTVFISDLEKHNDGIILLSGELPEVMLYENYDPDTGFDLLMLKKTLKYLQRQFKGRFFLQLTRNSDINEDEDAKEIDDLILQLSRSHEFGFTYPDGGKFSGIPLAAVSECLYATPDRHLALEVMSAMDDGEKLDIDGITVSFRGSPCYYMKTAQEMDALFRDVPEALANIQRIGEACNFKVEGRDPILPPFVTEAGGTEIEELRKQSFDGLEGRLNTMKLTDQTRRNEYFERLEYELGIIEGMGFPGYFLIVSDFIKWSKENDIPVGPGRGSGAGSMVAWALLITDLDPFEYGLLFERFLNPERVSMPDFDIDFCIKGRERVINYVREKYGEEKVALINTLGTYKSKNALKDSARALMHKEYGGFNFGEMNDICKMIPKKEGSADPMEVAEAFKKAEDFQKKMMSSDKHKALFTCADAIEGLTKSFGSHAAGVIIGDRDLCELVPIRYDEKLRHPVTQFNMKAAESVGLVKFDFLGLKNLSVIKMTTDFIQEVYGETVDIDAIDKQDEDVFKMLSEGRSIGVFQFESEGMQNVLRQVQPTAISDLIAVNALYRPGPMDQIPTFAARKNGEIETLYPTPQEKTKPFLEETYGIMVYQEQVMKVAQEVAGYSLGGADLLRRAMGKKIPEEMDKQRTIFVEGAAKNGISSKEANELFDTIAKFAGYGFNKSHAAAYSWVAYQTAWLKCHYPAAFFAALMTFEDKEERKALFKEDMISMGIKLLPPCILNSEAIFKPEADQSAEGGFSVRFGFQGVKGISDLPEALFKERAQQQFASVSDFGTRGAPYITPAIANKLAQVGAFDQLDQNRHRALKIVEYRLKTKAKDGKQTSMFDDHIEDSIPDRIMETKDWGDRIQRELEVVGFYFNEHPIDFYLPKLNKTEHVMTYRQCLQAMQANKVADAQNTHICAMVADVFSRVSRAGKQYLAVRLKDQRDQFHVNAFASKRVSIPELEEHLKMLKDNQMPAVFVMNLNLDDSREEVRLNGVIQGVKTLEDALEKINGEIEITIDTDDILDSAESSRIKIEAAHQKKEGTLTEQKYEETLKEAYNMKVVSKLGSIKEFLDTTRSDTGAGIIIHLQKAGRTLQSQKLPDLYKLSAGQKSRIKAFDGIVGLKEMI